nr:dolichol-phosphate mannosyltransferase subunit 3-like [Vulpes vulpes]
MRERDGGSVTITNLSSKAVKAFLDYAYTGETQITDDNVEMFFQLSSFLQWLWGLALLGSTWAALTTGALGLELPSPCREVLWPVPAYLLVSAGYYALGTVGYCVATFHDCEDAARELQSQVQEACADLARRGMRF